MIASVRVDSAARQIAASGFQGQTEAMILSRPRNGRILAGVCAGIARRYGWQPTTVRLLALLSFLLPGPQIVIYIVLWILMPKDPA